MPVELRKRKAPEAPAPPPALKKKASTGSGAAKATKPKPAEPKKTEPKKADTKADTKASAPPKESKPTKKEAPSKTSASEPPKAGDSIELDGFGGEIETNDGEKTTLKQLIDESKSGVVLLSYPKASTPGCTTQVCLARDSFTELTKTGLSIFGISRDSPKANTTFKTKQNLPYSLLCDKEGTLITAVGLKKAPSGTTRGVFVIDKTGKVLLAQPGSPKDTVEAVKKLVEEGKPEGAADGEGQTKAEEK